MALRALYHDILGSAGLSIPVVVRVLKNAGILRSLGLTANFVFFGRVLNAFSRQKYKNAFIPKSIIIETSFKCNLQCRDCYAPKDNTIISGEQFDSIVRQSERLGIYRFVLMGGEPTLPEVMDPLLPVIKQYSHCVFTFCTNCTQINQQFADKVKKYKNMFFLLSMEGTRDVTETRRGRGSYDSYLQAVKILRKNKIAFALSITLESENWKSQIDEAVIEDFVHAGGGIIYSYPRFDKKAQAFQMLPPMEYLQRVQALCKKYRVYWGDGHFGKMKASKGIIPRHNNQICISPYGDVRPFRFFYEPVFGNIKETPLIDILSKAELIEAKKIGRMKANEILKPTKETLKVMGFQVYDYKWRM